jgi:amidase
MQALRGSALGFGTDIGVCPKPSSPSSFFTQSCLGGSVSMPAAFNGVFSIKPSVGRVPTLGMPNSVSLLTTPALRVLAHRSV